MRDDEDVAEKSCVIKQGKNCAIHAWSSLTISDSISAILVTMKGVFTMCRQEPDNKCSSVHTTRKVHRISCLNSCYNIWQFFYTSSHIEVSVSKTFEFRANGFSRSWSERRDMTFNVSRRPHNLMLCPQNCHNPGFGCQGQFALRSDFSNATPQIESPRDHPFQVTRFWSSEMQTTSWAGKTGQSRKITIYQFVNQARGMLFW